ncbi:MAG: hypothetical protein LBU90_03220 [Bacteroidales bacterium]|nr:hypothetical protein [Bacteroidales bacterium]
MKQKFLFVGVICAVGLGAFLTSCGSDDTTIGCECFVDGDRETYTYSEMSNEYGVSSCSSLTSAIWSEEDGESTVSCKPW